MGHWTDGNIAVPFGNPNYDTFLGGSHDMTYHCTPNTPITQIAKGTVTDISSPSWGEQVTIQLDNPVENHKYFAILHLAAVNPNLNIGSKMNLDDLVGWSGGCVTSAQYNGTSNPTGKNFLNAPEMSSWPQVGIALCDGPKYGGVGWKKFPPIDTTLDPMPIVEAYRKEKPTDQEPDFKKEQFKIEWNAIVKGLPIDTGIAKQAYADYASGHDHGPATTREFKMRLWDGQVYTVQFLAMGFYSWDAKKGHANWHAFKS